MTAVPSRVTLSLVDATGQPLPEHIVDVLADVVTRVIAHPNADIDAVLERAQHIGCRAAHGEIGDLHRYATKALFAVAQRAERIRTQVEADVLRAIDYIDDGATEGANDRRLLAAEACIFLQELLGKLSPLDREVYVRHENGWKLHEIARELGISETMTWLRFRRAKTRLESWAKSKG